MGIGLRLVVIDVSDPSNIHALGQTEPLPGVVSAVALVGDYAFILTDGYGLSVLNISDPAQLPIVGSLKLAQPAYGLAVSDGYAYVASGTAGLRIIDVSDPEALRQVGSIETVQKATAVAVADHYAYVTEDKSSEISLIGALYVIDVADPVVPELVGSLELEMSPARAVAVMGDYAFIATYGVRIIDVSEPAHLRLIGSYVWDTAFDDVVVTSRYALLSENRYCDVVAVCPRTVQVLDISNPAQPRPLDTPSLQRDSTGAGRGMVIQNGLVYIATEVGLQVLEGPPWKTVGEYLTVRSLVDIVVANGVAYGVDGYRSLHIFDVRDPATPEVVSTFSDMTGSPDQVHLVDGYAALDVWDLGFAVVDVRQPQQPRQMAQIEVGGGLLDAVNGSCVYVIHGSAGGNHLSIYDIGDPAFPQRVSSIQLHRGGYAWLEIADRYAFLGSDGLIEIVDITNVKSPRKVGELALDPPEQARYPAMAVNGLYAYLIHQSAIKPFPVELLVYEFVAPAELRPVAVLALSHEGSGLAVVAGYAYVVGSDGLSVVDISNPAQPHLVGISEFGGEKLAVSEGYVYVAGRDSGLVILRVSAIAPGGS